MIRRVMEKISVIIPAYNAEKYLEQCVESVRTQIYNNIEIIIVNDGSTDRTAEIIERLKEKDSRIRTLHKRINEGIGATRNSALELVTGQYILFLDSDDWIDPNHISDLYNLLVRTDSDVSIANFTRYIESDNRYEIHITDDDYYEQIFTPQEWFTYQYGKPHNLSLCFTVPWGKLYKRSLFDNILYYTGPFGEDDRTTWKLYLVADKIAYMHRSTMVYRVNGESLTQTTERSEVFSVEPVLERLALLSMLGFDLKNEIAAFDWRANLVKNISLANGNVKLYKELQFQLNMIEKYRKN